jgi:HAE1 family hydrophobic/amphiphilic exporter-1
MDYIRYCIENPVKISVMVLLLVLFGILSLFTIPVQLVPNVDEPVITIETNWTGRSPEEVERQIVQEQEDKLKSVSNLKKLTAVSRQGGAEVKLEFYIGVDLNRALLEVSDKLREVPEYPDGVDEPVVNAADAASENAIAWMILDAKDDSFDIQSLYDFADKRIKPYMERVEGLARINIYGGREREVHVRIDPRKMAQRGITFNQLRAAIQTENINVSAGDIVDGRQDVRISVNGQYEDLDTIRQTVVAYTEGGPIRISDLGDVVLTLEKRRSFVHANGKPALAINAIRETGSNVISVMEGLRQRIDGINRDVLPDFEGGKHGLAIRQVYDETVYIYDALNLVTSNLWIGGSLATLTLLVFLRTLRPTLIIALSIPISVIGTFLVMAAAGRNVNVVSLAGLAFAVGMVVDNSIVVLENTDRHIGLGLSPWKAAYRAAQEVWSAILASTLTTLAVFVPVLTIKEEAGQLFRDISLAICAAVTLSLIVSVTVIPSAAAHYLKPRAQTRGAKAAAKDLLGLATLVGRFNTAYADMIHRLCAPTAATMLIRAGIVAAFTVVSILLSMWLMPPTTYLPNGNRNLVFGMMMTPPAYNITHNEFIGERIEAGVRPYWEAKDTDEATRIGPVTNFMGQTYPRVPAIENYFFVSFNNSIFMGGSSKDKELVEPLGTVLSGAMMSIPGSFGFAFQMPLFGRVGAGGNSIEVELSSPNLDELRRGAEAMYGQLTGAFGFQSVRSDPMNFNLSGPELQIRTNPARASELGINMADMGLAVSALIDGATLGDYRYEGDTIDLVLIRHPDYVLRPETIGMVPVSFTDRAGNRGTIPLQSIASIVQTQAPQQINRIEQQRSITLSVQPPETVALETASKQIDQMRADLVKAGALPPSVEVDQAGTADKLVQVREALLGSWHGFTLQSAVSLISSRMFLALLITFLVMAALFESYLYPFVIMFTVPLATVGGFAGLAIVHHFVPQQQLDVVTMLGFVILIGVVVNNAILLVAQSLNFMRGIGESEEDKVEVLAPREAIRESVRTRMRPIFMTTLTSVLGMIPLVVMPGSGSELYRGLGSVVTGGLLVATLFTLLVVPLMFSLVLDVKIRIYRALNWRVPELGERERLSPVGSAGA